MISETQGQAPASNHFVPLGQAAPQHDAPGADDASASLMADMAGGADAPVDLGPKKRPRFSSQIVLMLGVLAISAAALYLMRRAGTGAGMTFVATPLDYSLEQDQPDRLADHQRIIRQLESIGVLPQVPPDDVEKNPFQLVLPDESVDIADLDPDAQSRAVAELRRKELEARQREIGLLVGSVRIHSIMNGRIPVANIYDGQGDRLVRVGDAVGEHLVVAAINDRQVVLTADGERYTIEMGTNATPPRTPRRR